MKKACSVCLINCLRLHGAEEDEDAETCVRFALRKPKRADAHVDRHPSFLQKVTESTMSTLKLPLSFVANHTERLGESVILEGPGKKQWRVELRRTFRSFNISFGQGWLQFVADHDLQIGDQLAFSLPEKSYFQIEVYDGFGVQKRSALDSTNETHVQENIKNEGPKDYHGVGVACILGQEEHDRPEKGAQLPEKAIESPEKAAQSPEKPMESAETDKGWQLLPPQTLESGKVVSQRRPITQEEKVQALQGAHTLKLINPNTLMVMAKGQVYKGFWLAIPKPFAKEFLPFENKEITLLNKSGHKWPAKWLASQGALSGGWRRFSLDHRLEEHDVCVFELVDKTEHTLLVHIFRVLGGSEEDPGLYTFASTRVRSTDGKRNAMESSLAVSRSPTAVRNSSEGQESIDKHIKHTPEPSSGTKSHKRKPCLKDDVASGSLFKAKRLGDSEERQCVNRLADYPSMDERDDSAVGNKVALNSDVEPSASCDAKANPTSSPRDSRDSIADLVRLGKNLLSGKCLGDIDPSGARPTGADKVHEQISNSGDVSLPAGDQCTPSSVESQDERKNHQGQLYRVVHIYKGRNVGNHIDYLAEIEGYTEESSTTNLDRDDDTRFWWIPSDLFEWDMLSCRIK